MRFDFSPVAAERKSAWLLFAFLGALLALTGYWKLFAHFATYDDEGYILISARNYFQHGHLYDHVYSQYGPAYYAALDVLQRVLGPVDNSIARFLCLALWLGTAGACATLVWRQTRSVARTSFTLSATFLYLYFLADEPFHPGAVIIFVLATSVTGTSELVRRDRRDAVAILCAATGTVLLLIKINVGIFYFAAITAWGMFNATSPALQKAAVVLVPLGLAGLAAVLMRTLWDAPWIHIYILVFAIGAMATALCYSGESRFTRRQLAWFAGSSLLVAAVVLGAVALRGTSLLGLIDGVLLRPLHHPGNYSYPVDWRPGTVAAAVLSLGLAAYCRFARPRSPATVDRLLIALRVVVLAGLVVSFALLMHARVIGALFSYVAPLVWIFVTSRATEKHDHNASAIRGLIGFVLLLQFLHAYPVGGSQESWGTFLFIPLAALAAPAVRLAQPLVSSARLAAGLVALVLAKTIWATWESAQEYSARAPLTLPGTDGIRIPEQMASAYQILAVNAVAHADLLFSLPGMYSLNLWTGLPTPTQKNTTLWFTLLTEAEQGAIIDALEKSPRACVLVQEPLVDLMRAGQVPIRGPLVNFIARSFAPVFRLEGFAYMVRAGRQVAAINLAEVRDADASIAFNMIGDGRAIAGIEIIDLGSKSGGSANINVTTLSVTPITTIGHPTGQTESRRLPAEIKGLVRVVIDSRTAGVSHRASQMIVLRDSTGGVLSKIRFADGNSAR